jgi:hypothetical protein
VKFRPCSTYGHHRNPKTSSRPYVGEIDEFAVFCPELGSVYLIPIDDVDARRYASLRVAPARNGQVKNVRLAAPYEIARLELY